MRFDSATDDYIGRAAVPRTGSRRAVPRGGVPNELNPNAGTAAGSNPFQFDDPYTRMLEEMSMRRIGQLQQPFNDAGLDEVLSLIRGQLGSMGGMQGPRPADNALLGDFMTQGRRRIAELNEEPFSSEEEGRLRTRALGNVEELRAAGKQRATEDAARRGLGESSGIIQEAYQTVDRDMDRNRTAAETDLAQYITSERNRRRSEATGIAGQLASAGAQNAALFAQNENSRVGFEQARSGQIMQMAGALADIAAQKRGETRANQNDIMQIATMLSQLAPQRLAMAMGVLNGTGGTDVNSIFGNQLNLSNMQTGANQTRDAGTANMMAGLGQLLAYFANQRRAS